MKEIVLEMEETLGAISVEELKKNSKANTMVLEVKRKINELKIHLNLETEELKNQGVLKYINPKILLEN